MRSTRQLRLSETPYGHALLSLLRYAWLGAGRRELFSFLRSPYSGLARAHADFLEGRLRGRGLRSPERLEATILELRGQPLPALDRLRAASTSIGAVRELAGSMLRAAYGLESPPATEGARLDLRAYQAVLTLLDELEGWAKLGGELSAEELVAAIERAPVRSGAAAAGPRRRSSICSAPARAGPRSCSFSAWKKASSRSARRRRRSSTKTGAATSTEPPGSPSPTRSPARDTSSTPRARGRRGASISCARRRTMTARPARRAPSGTTSRAVLDPDDLPRATRRRALSELVWPIESAPSERERLRALAWLSTYDSAGAGCDRARERMGAAARPRARGAFDRPTRLTDPAVLESLRSRAMFGVTELEAFAGCSSIWFVERLLDPKSMDVEVDARMRGSIAHQALYKFFSGLPKRLGTEQVSPEQLDDALEFLGECLADAIAGGAESRLELTDLQRSELRQGLWRDLEALVRAEAESEHRLVPRQFEVSFGSERSAPELQRGLDLETFFLSGKIDRIDLDPFAARGIVWDYKSGKKAHSAAEIERELRLQIPLYMLVLRDLVGVEPLGGLYRPLSGDRKARGLLRATAKDDGVPGHSRATTWTRRTSGGRSRRRRRERARSSSESAAATSSTIRARGSCPSWCELGPMCRVRRR